MRLNTVNTILRIGQDLLLGIGLALLLVYVVFTWVWPQ